MNFPGGLDMNDPKVQQTWVFFQQQMMMQQQQQMQQQQLWMFYKNFCQSRGLNVNDQNSFNLFIQQNQQNQQNQFNNFGGNIGFNNFNQQNQVNNFGNNNGLNNNNFINNQQNTNNHEYINSNLDNNSTAQQYKTNVSNVSDEANKTNPNEPKLVIPRSEKTLYLNEKGEHKINYTHKDQNIINISFVASTGLRLIIATPNNITVNQLLKKYMDRLGLPMEHIDKDLTFLHNGGRIDPYSNQLISKDFKNNMTITVFDKSGVVGA